jgi:hypothetical protein
VTAAQIRLREEKASGQCHDEQTDSDLRYPEKRAGDLTARELCALQQGPVSARKNRAKKTNRGSPQAAWFQGLTQIRNHCIRELPRGCAAAYIWR